MCYIVYDALDLVLESDVKNREELVRILLQYRALPRGLPTSRESPLSMCIQTDNSDLAVILLQHGADENDLIEREGESALRASLRIGCKKGEILIYVINRFTPSQLTVMGAVLLLPDESVSRSQRSEVERLTCIGGGKSTICRVNSTSTPTRF